MAAPRKLKRLVFVSSLSLLFLVIILSGNDPPRVKAVFPLGPSPRSPFITTFPRLHDDSREVSGVKVEDGKVKVILLWTHYFGSDTWSTGPDTFRSCAVKTCRISREREEVEGAAAVMVNVRNVTSRHDLPLHHPPHQVWIVHGSEPPYYVYVELSGLNNVFNWTSWYRSDADIFSPYGFFVPTPSTGASATQAPDDYHRLFLQRGSRSAHDVTQHLNVTHPLPHPHVTSPPDNDVNDDVFSQHDLWIFWMASSCVNYGRRYKLVHEMAHYLPVDTYGSCGDNICRRNHPTCDAKLRRYKFVLSFENGYCRDYVTEKYWEALRRRQIPIVSGGGDYAKLVVPGSYIDVDDFQTVEELAAFVRRVGSDRHLYNSFFLWRHHYRRVDYGVSNWCQICAALHSTNVTPQVYSDLRGWVAQDTCPLYQVHQPIWWAKLYVVFRLFGI